MTNVLLDGDVRIPLRDAVVTTADVWRAAEGPPGPAILVRTPYGRETPFHLSPIDPRAAAARGYALVVQDVRGRGGSQGEFRAFTQEREDGFDSIEWVAAQPWCNGDVVMSGFSYLGAAQWLAAGTKPPSLRAIAPLNSSHRFGEGWSFTNGVREQGFLASWIAGSLAPPSRQLPDRVTEAMADPSLLSGIMPEADTWFAMGPDDDYWQECSVDPGEVEVPVFVVSGWFDCFVDAAIVGHQSREHPDDRLLIGAWPHDNWFGSLAGDQNLGTAGSGPAIGLGTQLLDFFDAALRRAPSPMDRVRTFVLGAKRWITGATWPPETTTRIRVSLLEGGTFEVDADALPPSLGGRALFVGVPDWGWGPRDQSPLTRRPDVLCLPLLSLGRTVVAAGPAFVNLIVEEDGPGERQWVVALCTRSPTGSLDLIGTGVANAPGETRRVTIPLGDLCLEITDDESLFLVVSAGSVPRWEPIRVPGRRTVTAGSSLELTVIDP